MPNPPRAKITLADLNSQFYQLSEVDFVIFNGYRYKLDLERYESNVRDAHRRVREIQNNSPGWNDFLLTQGVELNAHDQYMQRQHQQALQVARENYLNALDKCDIIDEDGKICGEYFKTAKEYKIFCWRFIVDGDLYYRDEYDDLWSYGHSYVGHLKDDGITIDYDSLFVVASSVWE